MKQTTKIAVAGLLSAAGAVLSAFAAEFNGGEAEPAAETPAPKKTTKKTPTPAAATEEKPAETEEKKEETVGKTYEELRALIEPLVKAGQGEDVKKIIAKYSEAGLKGMESKNHAAFEKDIAALSY